MAEPRWESYAKAGADATGKMFIVGYRPWNGSWFANCDDVEVDGPTPAAAAKGVVEELKQVIEVKARAAARDAGIANTALENLHAAVPDR